MIRYDYFKGNDGKWYVEWIECGVHGICTMCHCENENDCINWCRILNHEKK